MAAEDPILACAACGAKLRLKAASIKILKQVRCGKCQAVIEIPPGLKEGDEGSSAPVVAPPGDKILSGLGNPSCIASDPPPGSPPIRPADPPAVNTTVAPEVVNATATEGHIALVARVADLELQVKLQQNVLDQMVSKMEQLIKIEKDASVARVAAFGGK